MKPCVGLVGILRRLFGASRAVAVVYLVFTPFELLPMPASASVTVPFQPTPFIVSTAFHPAAADVKLTALTGSLQLNDKAVGDEISKARRVAEVPHHVIATLLWFVLSQLLWRLCRNVEGGEVFSATNFRLVRNLGLVLVSAMPALAASNHWAETRLGIFVVEHVTVTGLQPATVPSADDALGWLIATMKGTDLRFVLVGLLLLVLAEIFREGLALKQEADLTV